METVVHATAVEDDEVPDPCEGTEMCEWLSQVVKGTTIRDDDELRFRSFIIFVLRRNMRFRKLSLLHSSLDIPHASMAVAALSFLGDAKESMLALRQTRASNSFLFFAVLMMSHPIIMVDC